MATNNLGRYLGFPIIHKGRVGSAFKFILDKVQSKLTGWKTKLLSRAGRLVLVKSAVAPIADYYMQCHSIPIKVYDSIDKMTREFIWGSTEEKRKMHMIKWNTITLPKELGGLGLSSMKYRNQAMLATLCWRLAREEGMPWARMLQAKYLWPSRMTEEGRKLPCFRIWAACKKGGPIYVKGLRWTIKSGDLVNMWMDFWLPLGRLREIIEGPLSRGEAELTVKQCFDENNTWIPSSISFDLPENIINTIMATPFSFDPNSVDELMWAFLKNGLFSLKSAYLIARGLNPLNLNSMSFSWVWKIDTPPKVQFFLWLCLHSSLPTAEVLGSRGLMLDPVCKICNRENETIEHLFKGYDFAHNF